jgi:hypothetical protein
MPYKHFGTEVSLHAYLDLGSNSGKMLSFTLRVIYSRLKVSAVFAGRGDWVSFEVSVYDPDRKKKILPSLSGTNPIPQAHMS